MHKINFVTGNKPFFIAQAFGWGLFGLSNFAVQSIAGMPADLVQANATFAVCSGFLVTTVYRWLIRSWGWQYWKLWRLMVFIALSSLCLAVIWLLITGVCFQLLLPKYQIAGVQILSNITLGALLFLLWNLIYFFFKYFVKYQQAEIDKWQLVAEVKEAQLGSLRAQLRPHFVFNALNNIRALVLENSERAREMLSHFSDLLRYSLQHDEHKFVKLEDELEVVRQYLELMSIHYEERLQWSIEAAPETLSLELPPMLLHLLVENAVKHGIAPAKETGHVLVSSHLEAAQVVLKVKNPGSLVPRPDVEGQLGTGLRNIGERLRIFYGESAQFSLHETEGWVVAIITLPKSIS